MTACPCCKQFVAVQSMEEIATARDINGFEASILVAVWNDKGEPAPTHRVFDAMYADDPDGGPSMQQMYRQMAKSILGLLGRLDGSGISIVKVGRSGGYRLVFRSLVDDDATIRAAMSMRKYPAAKDFSSIAETLLSNARSDGGDGLNIDDLPRSRKRNA